MAAREHAGTTSWRP